MNGKRAIRAVFKYTLLDQVFEFVYWIAVLAGLVLLGSTELGLPLLIACVVLYSAVAIGLYFWVIRRLRRFFES